jgi:hypothetical protein
VTTSADDTANVVACARAEAALRAATSKVVEAFVFHVCFRSVRGDGAPVTALPPPLVHDLVRLLATLPAHDNDNQARRHLVDYLNSDDGADTHESRIGVVDSSGARIALLRNLFSLTEPACVRALGTVGDR